MCDIVGSTQLPSFNTDTDSLTRLVPAQYVYMINDTFLSFFPFDCLIFRVSIPTSLTVRAISS